MNISSTNLPEIYRQSLVRRPVFSLVRLLVRPSGRGRIAWLLPRASPVAPTCAPSRARYAISCTPIPSWSSSKCRNTPSTNQLHVFAFQVGRSVWLNKDYCLNTSSSSNFFRQGGNAWNLFDSDNQSAAIFCVDTIKYNSLPSVPSGLEEVKTRPDGWQTARHFKMSRGKCTYYYNCCSAHASIRSTGGTWYHGMYYRLSKHFLLLIILPSENIRHTWYMIFQCKLAW